MSRRQSITESRNVFKDLGIPNAEEHLVKAQLVSKIDAIMKERRLKQAEAAGLLGIKQPDVIQDAARRIPTVFRRAAAALPGGPRSGCCNRGKTAS
jgi:predicted XRE-type DNA-binding protein